MQYFQNSDIIMRRFMKDRNGVLIPYDYTTRSHIFHATHETPPLLSSILAFMVQVFVEGYTERELGCSNAEALVGRFFTQRNDSDLIEKARCSGFQGKGRQMHPICQDYMIKYDPLTIACELPVWNDERSGFIDVVRYNPKEDVIEVCDFKPNAHKEKHPKVLTQLTHYRQMLSERTGISLNKITAYYFDDFNCYQLIDGNL